MFLIGVVCVVMCALCLGATVIGWVLALLRRGTSEVRRGPEISIAASPPLRFDAVEQ